MDVAVRARSGRRADGAAVSVDKPITIYIRQAIEAVGDKVLSQIDAKIDRALAAMLEADKARPLERIIDLPSAAAARMRVARDPELRRLGFKVGRRVMFRPSEVIAYLRLRGR